MESIGNKTKITLVTELQECKKLLIDIRNVKQTSEDKTKFASSISTGCHCSHAAENKVNTTNFGELIGENKKLLKDIQSVYSNLYDFKCCDKAIKPTLDDTTANVSASKPQPTIADLDEHVRSALLDFLKQNRDVLSLLSKEVECHKVDKQYNICRKMEHCIDTVLPDTISSIITDITTDLEDIQDKCLMFSNSKLPTEASEDRDSAYSSDPRKVSECLRETYLPDSLLDMKPGDHIIKCLQRSGNFSVKRRTSDAKSALPVENDEYSSIAANDEKMASIRLHDKNSL